MQTPAPTSAGYDDINLFGRKYREGESSTETVGRLLYERTTGQEPKPQTQNLLSYLVHWGYGLLQGGI